MPRRVVALAVATLAITLAMCLALFGYAKYVRVMGHVESLRQHLHSLEARGPEELLSAVQDGELEKIRGELLQAGQALRALKAELGLAASRGWRCGRRP
jgi:hypothetical protein